MKKELIWLIIALVLVSGVLVFKTMEIRSFERKEEREAERVETVRKEKETRLRACLNAAENDWWADWKLNCTAGFEYDDLGNIKSCEVPTDLAEDINDQRQKDKDNCFRLYQ